MSNRIDTLKQQFVETRRQTEEICKPLETEDYVVQPIDFVSPPKWHLAHTSWFFEEFILKGHLKNYTVFDPNYAFLFNSYYESVGKMVFRADRGNLSQPSVKRVLSYRQHVTKGVQKFLELESIDDQLLKIIEIGINHEQQHQELLLTDIKYILGNNPLFPVYNKHFKENRQADVSPKWINISEGIYEIGLMSGGKDFRYDNEMGRHKVYLNDFKISNKLVTNGEYLDFINDKGYSQPLLWHSDARAWVKNNQIEAPLYWHKIEGKWYQYTLSGLKKLDLNMPLSHISYYEAFAYAQWKKLRLPTEDEWEIAQSKFDWGQRWEWTESAYLPYPNYKKPEGAIGEYNGKFMVNQKVLRGASVATPKGHSRATYRNFFHPPMRWQYTGLRLAK